MRLEVLKAETSKLLNDLFRKKVQGEEQLKETEAQIQFQRGVFAALSEAQKVIMEINRGEAIEEAPLPAFSSNCGEKVEMKATP